MVVEGCMACDVLRGVLPPPGGIIYEDPYWQVDHALAPIALAGWLILKPKRHCEHLAALTPPELSGLGPLLGNTARALDEAVHPVKIHIHLMAESVKHLHFYIIPRQANMPANGLALLQEMFDGRWATDDAAAAAVVVRVRPLLQRLMAETPTQ
ncbi:MAG TPA: HIT family protein [Chloroflexia bacterium]|nr:HIT family protein [Chloroflexia bacterium]